LNFVKGLLLGSEEEKKIGDRSNSKRGKRPRTRTMSSISLFLSQYEGNSHDQIDNYDSDEDEPDCYNSRNQDANSKQQEREELANKLRILREHPPTEQQHWDDTQQKNPSRSPSPTESEYSSDSSYESEAEDEFSELPVKFRSIEELKSDEEVDDDDDDDATEDTAISSITEKDIRERDLNHAEELERHREELENLHNRFEQSTQEHYEEFDSMERRFRDESLKREDLLERALSYAEKLEASGRKKKKELTANQAALEQCAHEHFQKIEAIRRHQREELREQKKEILEESAVRHTKELEHLQKCHEEELTKPFDQMMEKFTFQLSHELQLLQDRHNEDLSKQRNIILEESSLHQAKELKALKSRYERDLADREKIHDETIQKLRTEGVQKDEELQKLQTSMNQARSNDAIELRRLKKQLEDTEHYHSQELQTALRQNDSVVEQANASKWFSPNAQIAMSDASTSSYLDLTCPTVTTTPPSSCDSSLNGDDDQSVTTNGSQRSSSEEWETTIGRGVIVNPL
jgi:hypothetical protein